MFNAILIANRGEIACRVIRSAKALGIRTVAIYSDADAAALHVHMADEAVNIGPPAAAQSYLLAERLIEACKTTGADAVHPGYGFLSERASFAEALASAGITFIGPNPHAIEAMGDKITSKKVAAEAGVSTVPGYLGILETPDDAIRIANDIGYPVMIKASAGGGGKGMRIAYSPDEVREGFDRSRSEAASSFGDDRLFVEKFIENPRHIEIQVLGDKHGNCVYLGERECSIQRRNQKVIEEAPSPLLDPQTRARMGEQAVALAQAVNYDSAGTVEFVVGQDRSFYFLEMNTRLQVEHPVTELITGVDLVEQMIRVAAGKPLELRQEDVQLDGWSVESRIYAEDPVRGFLPSIGRLTNYVPPLQTTEGETTVRVDTGVVEGSEISMFYDPMIAKLVTHAPTRIAAIETMEDALDAFQIDGIQHNMGFLSALMGHPRWKEGALTTNFIAEEFPDGFTNLTPKNEDAFVLAAVALSIELIERTRLDHLTGRLRPHTGQIRSEWSIYLDEASFDASAVTPSPDTTDGIGFKPPINFSFVMDERTHTVQSAWKPDNRLWTGTINGNKVAVRLKRRASRWSLQRRGADVETLVLPKDQADLQDLMPEKVAPDTSKYLLCPMPGLVVSIHVREGETVQPGQQLAIVEAMKMENILRAEREGVVKEVLVEAGDSLSVDQVMIAFE
ncbi:MAG: acetyl/propionyl/methylcrotonyl-CoA carboxylase subunit alpha [Pseudomonadota bacterium]